MKKTLNENEGETTLEEKEVVETQDVTSSIEKEYETESSTKIEETKEERKARRKEERRLKREQKNKEDKEPNKVLQFFITTLNGMAYGLFATLIIGTIIGTIGKLIGMINVPFFQQVGILLNGGTVDGKKVLGCAQCIQFLTGAGIGIGIAHSMKLNTLKTIVLGSVGELAAFLSLSTKFVTEGLVANKMQIGDPLTIYLVVISVALLMELVLRKKTPVDILIVPLFGCFIAIIIAWLIRYPAIYVTYGIQWVVDKATTVAPFIMGIIISVVMGMALTAPISSAAIAAMIFTVPAGTVASLGLRIASGAAVVGCSTQMVGFAIQSRKDNNIGMIFSVGIGTSMLQFKNILKKPIIWLPTIIASAILGPISTCVLKLECMGSSAGMGTAGLVGQIGTIASMGVSSWQAWVGIFVLQIGAPILLTWAIDLLFRKFNLIKDGDLKV